MQRTLFVAALAATSLAACTCGPATTCSTTFCSLEPGATSNADFSSPFDATLSPDGKIAYFVAVTPNGAGVFSQSIVPSGSPTLLVAGDPLASPLAVDITSDAKLLYIADASAGAGEADLGRLFTLSPEGGTPQEVTSTAGYQPRGLSIVVQGTDQVYFSGNDPADGQPGVFKIAAGANTVVTVAKGAPFIDPSGLAISKNGTVYVADTADSDKTAMVLKITNGVVEPLLTNLRLGYPAGLALTPDDKTLIISALDPMTGKDLVQRLNLSDMTTEPFTSGIDTFEESAGLHRAKNIDSYVWADSLANNGGTVYVINKVE
jgi:DNA-binding beta-propeller fold protein YncE